jgi:uncharacterized membrane protein
MPTVVLAALAIGWLVLLVAAPMLPTFGAVALYAAGSFICHQRPERSFHLESVQLPVCARCLGVYAGAAAGAASRLMPGADPVRGARTVLLLGVAPTLATIALEWSGLWTVGNVVRAAAGVPIGLAAAFVLVPRRHVNQSRLR